MTEKKASTDYPIHELLAERWSPYAFDDRPVPKADLRYHLSLDFKPQGQSKQAVQTVGQFIEARRYLTRPGIFVPPEVRENLIKEGTRLCRWRGTSPSRS